MHGPWQVGHLSASDYTKQAARWAHALRLVDPTIKLVSCGNQGNSEWDREVLQGLIGVCDYHSIHFYSMLGHERFDGPQGLEYEKNVFGPIVSRLDSTLVLMVQMADGDRDARSARRPPNEVSRSVPPSSTWPRSITRSTRINTSSDSPTR